MRIFAFIGGALIVLGLILCLTIVGAAIGVPMILIGAVLAFLGRKPRPIVVQVSHDVTDSVGRK